MRRFVFPVALLALLAGAGCRRAAAVPHELLYLDSAEAPATASIGQPVVVTIHGNKPDPAWVADDPQVDREGQHVTISVVGHRSSSQLVVQVLVPFTTTATLSDLPAGSYSLHVVGRQKSVDQELVVLP
ncbi:MAG: hypothetical protein KGR26_13590 [Cyanobacteria bacterium REEB65]|nr:hypothetical protein [Cyanobacteria bacterium REEB65]